MEGGRVNDFIDAFSYQSVEVMFNGEKYFYDGITTKPNGKYSFFIIKVDANGEILADVYEYSAPGIDNRQPVRNITTQEYEKYKKFFNGVK